MRDNWTFHYLVFYVGSIILLLYFTYSHYTKWPIRNKRTCLLFCLRNITRWLFLLPSCFNLLNCELRQIWWRVNLLFHFYLLVTMRMKIRLNGEVENGKNELIGEIFSRSFWLWRFKKSVISVKKNTAKYNQIID